MRIFYYLSNMNTDLRKILIASRVVEIGAEGAELHGT